MTRQSLNSTLRRVTVWLVLVLLVALGSKLATIVPQLKGTEFAAVLGAIYEFLRDMALVFVTLAAAYLANVFQKRSMFVESLRAEWRAIVKTKGELFAFCEKPYPSADDYLAAFCRISESIDNMRIVYRNVGETDDLIGLYPYAPLHDMRRALATLDPRKSSKITPEQRALARDAILQSFYALRESFLDELDMEEPSAPITAAVARRMKRPGTTKSARRDQEGQVKRYEAGAAPRPDVDHLLSDLYYREVANEHVNGRGANDAAERK